MPGIRSFLGLASYYRCFIKDFASIARPLTDLLKGENRKTSAQQFKNPGIEAFEKLKQILISEDVTLLYPDFTKPFDLTTDASAHGLGAVLSQNGKPITMISRTLKDNEMHFATNERELLAIVWALKNLRNYLYGARNLNIYTDHQPLTFAVSDRNPNAKIKRRKAFIDEHNANILYKPGKENYVADALSRQNINAFENEPSSDAATIHSETSLTNCINKTDNPINCYRNQIVIEEAKSRTTRTFIMFGTKRRHFVQFSNRDDLIETVTEIVNPDVVNATHCELPILANIQHKLVEFFPATKFWYSDKFVTDIFAKVDQKEIIVAEHNRAHRSAQENVKQILRDYYFPKMTKMANDNVKDCKICSRSKYNRHPVKQPIGESLIPSYTGEMLHIDIFSTDKKYFLTCIDKFSNLAIVQPILSLTITDLKPPILQLVNIFPNITTIYCDNEASLKSETVKSM